jgi:2-polyprenyl-3-methyl-5-hydroxy-6-metoxy-1,4-benzoquinol methylase
MAAVQSASSTEVSPALLVDAMFAVRKTAAIKAAIELDLFTMIGSGRTAKVLAAEAGCAERGVRIICDYLVVAGFLTKSGETYVLTPSSAVFLDSRSPAYMGAAIEFIAAPEMMSLLLQGATESVRNGGATGLANIAPDNPVWVKFARAMGAFTGSAARVLAAEVAAWSNPPHKVLDIAAGPGYFGIEIARMIPSANIVALDWTSVLELTKQNAAASGVASRYSFIAGSAFEVDWGKDYDLVMLPNFLHHFDMEGCVALLKKARSSLKANGKLIAVDFVPNEDRISPPFPAAFAFEMLATTPKGDAYTASELGEMARQSGFRQAAVTALPPTPASLIVFV